MSPKWIIFPSSSAHPPAAERDLSGGWCLNASPRETLRGREMPAWDPFHAVTTLGVDKPGQKPRIL